MSSTNCSTVAVGISVKFVVSGTSERSVVGFRLVDRDSMESYQHRTVFSVLKEIIQQNWRNYLSVERTMSSSEAPPIVSVVLDEDQLTPICITCEHTFRELEFFRDSRSSGSRMSFTVVLEKQQNSDVRSGSPLKSSSGPASVDLAVIEDLDDDDGDIVAVTVELPLKRPRVNETSLQPGHCTIKQDVCDLYDPSDFVLTDKHVERVTRLLEELGARFLSDPQFRGPYLLCECGITVKIFAKSGQRWYLKEKNLKDHINGAHRSKGCYLSRDPSQRTIVAFFK
jgi:hypothetical protein